jgi:phenylpropionate dioxygenase-like ring-hydroxylating dioxygenase large terminal subunit
MYINFWYPVATSEEINTDKPLKVEILSLRFVAFRDDDGHAHVLSDTCVHRGGSLGEGWIQDNCVVCPYHGWRYSGDGRCTTIPSIGYDGKPPPRAKVDSYPVEEKYGIVFAFLGDLPKEERPPLLEIEEFGTQEWRSSEVMVLNVDYYYERSIENGLDPAHNEFVHPTHGFQGAKPEYHVPDFDIKDLELGCYCGGAMDSSEYKDDTMKQVRDGAGKTVAGTGTHGPNSMFTYINFTPENAFHQYMWEAPINENQTRIFFMNLRNCMMDPEMDNRVRERNLEIAHQDIVILSKLDPIRTPYSNTKEILMPADKAVARYREWMKRWERKGWRVDVEALRAKRGDIAFAIPSPARRDSGNWVLDEVPLIAESAEQQSVADDVATG